MPRYAIAGIRPGTVIHTTHGLVRTNPADAGADLTPPQVAELEAMGYPVTPIGAPPADAEPALSLEDLAAIAKAKTQNEISAKRLERETLKPLRKRTALSEQDWRAS
jgi:hypothetical protein